MTAVGHAVDIELVGIGESYRCAYLAIFVPVVHRGIYRPQCDLESPPPSPTGSSKTESRVTPGVSLNYEDDEPLNAVSLPPTVCRNIRL